MIFMTTPRSFYVLRFLLGCGGGRIFSGSNLLSEEIGCLPRRAPDALALFMTAGPLAGVVGGPISGVLMGIQKFGSLARAGNGCF